MKVMEALAYQIITLCDTKNHTSNIRICSRLYVFIVLIYIYEHSVEKMLFKTDIHNSIIQMSAVNLSSILGSCNIMMCF